MIKIAFPTDEHCPFQDNRARNLAMQITRIFDPNLRVAGSDGLDFYNVSKYDKNPERIREGGIQKEIDEWVNCQREWIDASPSASVYFLIGNHEDRLRRWLWRHPELYGLDALNLPTLLEFEKLNIPWNKEENAHLELDVAKKLLLTHGKVVRKHSAYTARAVLEDEHYSRNVVFGHSHRGGTHMAMTRDGVVIAQEAFCLCRTNPEYALNPNWQQGLVLIEVDVTVSIEAIPFHLANGKLVGRWRGQEYQE